MPSRRNRNPDPGWTHDEDIVRRSPTELAPHEIPLGWEVEPPQRLGFDPEAPPPQEKRLVAYAGDAHVMTVARTGAGKGRGCTIPWLLHLRNPAIVLDVKGEAYNVTARYRRDVLGHRIVLLDPFGLCGGKDALNPFDLIRKDHVDIDAEVLTELFQDGRPVSTKDPFWDNTARSFFVGCVAHIATAHKHPSPVALRDLLLDDNVPLRLATLLDNKGVVSELARREFATFLNHEQEKVRTSVLSTAQQNLRPFAAESVARAMSTSTLKLDDVIRGEPATIYLAMPPENLASHGSVLRLWVGTLLQAVTRRRQRVPRNTVFLLDEIAQCGTLPILRQAMSLLRGYGLTTVTLWQDLAQLQRNYDDWRSLMNNCAVIQTFGTSTFEMARTMGEIIGVLPQQLRSMQSDEAMVAPAGKEPFVVRRLDYLRDEMFAGRAVANPWFRTSRRRRAGRDADGARELGQ